MRRLDEVAVDNPERVKSPESFRRSRPLFLRSCKARISGESGFAVSGLAPPRRRGTVSGVWNVAGQFQDCGDENV